MEEEKLIDESERLRIDTINKINHIHSLELSKQILLRIEEDPKARENYNSFITMCEINELLNKVVIFIKTHGTNNESYSFNQNVPFENLVSENEFVNFALSEIIPKIDTEVLDMNNIERVEERKEKRVNKAKGLYKCTIEELRMFLYFCNSLKPVQVPKMAFDRNISLADAFAAGVDPEAILRNNGNWFLEKKDYDNILNNNISEIIVSGKIFGVEIPKRLPVENKNKKNTSFH